MKLSATIDLDELGRQPHEYVHYVYDTLGDEHTLTIWQRDPLGVLKPRKYVGIAGHVLNPLGEFRGIPEVDELIAWLAR